MSPRSLSAICRLLFFVLIVGVFNSSHATYEEPINAKKFFPASRFPLAEQRRLAARVLGDNWLRDVEAETYLKQITRQLAPEDEHFVIVADSDAVNAFAYLGGIVVMYRGLWQFADEEDGFIGVVAHEIGHVRLDHVQKTRDNAARISTLATPFLIAGLLIDDPEVREAVVAGSAGVISGDIIAYSRELEHEADVVALTTMQESGHNPWAMARIFSRLGVSGNEYLSTHPASDRRGAYLSDRLHGVPEPATTGRLAYYLLRDKLARQDVVEPQYQQTRRAVLASPTATAAQKLLAQYGLLLSATKTRNKKLGAEMVTALAAQKNPIIVRAIAANLRQRGQSQQALMLLTQAAVAHPQHLALVLEMFSVYERLKQYKQALAMYRKLPAEVMEHPDVLLAAGRIAAFLQQRVLSNYLLALGHAHNGNFEQAQKQITVAEKFKDGKTDTVVKLEKLKKDVTHELRLLRERRVLETN